LAAADDADALFAPSAIEKTNRDVNSLL
jgi:hypothetical protein